jgi:hypothetical protein
MNRADLRVIIEGKVIRWDRATQSWVDISEAVRQADENRMRELEAEDHWFDRLGNSAVDEPVADVSTPEPERRVRFEDLFDTRVPPGEREDPEYPDDDPWSFDDPESDEMVYVERVDGLPLVFRDPAPWALWCVDEGLVSLQELATTRRKPRPLQCHDTAPIHRGGDGDGPVPPSRG